MLGVSSHFIVFWSRWAAFDAYDFSGRRGEYMTKHLSPCHRDKYAQTIDLRL